MQSIGLLDGFASDGPVGFVYFMAQIESASRVYKTCSYASECVIAATWNVDLAYKRGESVGNEGITGNQRGDGRPYSGWYAPAVNLHRSPFGGRNSEYYSEDPVLSGKLATEVIKGCRSKGAYCNFKHFAVNEQETNRSGVCTWFTEQALRELYLKPFEIAVKKGGSLAIMSSFNCLGTLWAGGNLNLATLPKAWTPTTASDYQIVRQCAKNIIYTTIRSNNMNGCGEGGYYVTYYAWWEVTLFFSEIGMLAITLIWGLLLYLNYRKSK